MATQNNILPFKATHPGILIKDELEARSNFTQKDLALELGVKPSFLNEIIKGKRPITSDTAVLLEKILDIPANYWLKFQMQYDIDKARIKEANIKKGKDIEIWRVFKEYISISHLKTKGYLVNGIAEDIEIIKKIFDIGSVEDLLTLYSSKRYAFYRKSEKLQVNERDVFTWSSLALYEAKNKCVQPFNEYCTETLCQELNTVFYENKNVLDRTETILSNYGIKFILLNKSGKAPIDGFSFWSEANPAIVLTLRYKELDKFAFNLMHELGHIFLHLKDNRDKQFLEIIELSQQDSIEKEANAFAERKLISSECWNAINKEGILGDRKIKNIGEMFGVNPAILLGRICFKTSRYAIKTKIDRRLG